MPLTLSLATSLGIRAYKMLSYIFFLNHWVLVQVKLLSWWNQMKKKANKIINKYEFKFFFLLLCSFYKNKIYALFKIIQSVLMSRAATFPILSSDIHSVERCTLGNNSRRQRHLVEFEARRTCLAIENFAKISIVQKNLTMVFIKLFRKIL